MTRRRALWACTRHMILHPWPDGTDHQLTGHRYLRRLRRMREDRAGRLVLLWPWLGLAVATSGVSAWLAIYGCDLPRVTGHAARAHRPTCHPAGVHRWTPSRQVPTSRPTARYLSGRAPVAGGAS